MTLAKGYTCTICGRMNRFSSWVYAHWDIVVRYTCACGQEAKVRRGRVIESKRTLARKPRPIPDMTCT
jgi:hypothetical protein